LAGRQSVEVDGEVNEEVRDMHFEIQVKGGLISSKIAEFIYMDMYGVERAVFFYDHPPWQNSSVSDLIFFFHFFPLLGHIFLAINSCAGRN